MVKDTRLATAMHEAGHVVAHFALGNGSLIDAASISSDVAGEGLVETLLLWQPYMATEDHTGAVREHLQRGAWEDNLQLLAGPIAELHWRRHSRAGIMFAAKELAERCLATPGPEGHSDLGRVRVRLDWAFPSTEREAFAKAWCATIDLILPRWPAVLGIGRKLQTAGHIAGGELADMYRELSGAGAHA